MAWAFGTPPQLSVGKASVLCRGDLGNCLGWLVMKSLVYWPVTRITNQSILRPVPGEDVTLFHLVHEKTQAPSVASGLGDNTNNMRLTPCCPPVSMPLSPSPPTNCAKVRWWAVAVIVYNFINSCRLLKPYWVRGTAISTFPIFVHFVIIKTRGRCYY